MSHKSDAIENTISWFSRIYLGGIPPTITDDSAFLSFISVLTAVEALAGYRYSDIKSGGDRFRRFIVRYFPETYSDYASDLWRFRNSIVHAFTTAKFALTHHHSESHFKILEDGVVILNAEDFYGALLWAAQRYIAELRIDPSLQSLMVARLTSPDGGGITVGIIEGPKASDNPSDLKEGVSEVAKPEEAQTGPRQSSRKVRGKLTEVPTTRHPTNPKKV